MTNPHPKHNVRRLVAMRVAQLIVDGSPAKDLASVGSRMVHLLANKQYSPVYAEASEWVRLALQAVRNGRGADPAWTDEDIAGMILEGVERKKQHDRKTT